MANVRPARPITPVGANDIVDSARAQDAERRQREAQDHFDRTGVVLPPYQEHSPLVPINGYSEPDDVAEDGDAYDNLGRLQNTNPPRVSGSDGDGTDALDIAADIATDMLGLSPNTSARRQRNEAMRQQQKGEEEKAIKEKEALKELREESKKKFKSAMSGLEIDDDNDNKNEEE